MYCKNCGKEISEDSNFCQYCGTNLKMEEKASNYQKNTNSVLEEMPYDEDTESVNPNWKNFLDNLATNAEIDTTTFRRAGLIFNSMRIKIEPFQSYVSYYCDLKNLAVRQNRDVEIFCNIYDINDKIICSETLFIEEKCLNSATIALDGIIDYRDLALAKKIKVYATVDD